MMNRKEVFVTELFSRPGFAQWCEKQSDVYLASLSPEALWAAYVAWYRSTTVVDFTVAEMTAAMKGVQ